MKVNWRYEVKIFLGWLPVGTVLLAVITVTHARGWIVTGSAVVTYLAYYHCCQRFGWPRKSTAK